MIKGIGIDMVTISEMADIANRLSEGCLARIFTPAELKAAHEAPDAAEYLATRFASKEAVFKAVSQLLDEGSFDLRIVETLNHEDGSPYVNVIKPLRDVLDRSGVLNLFISITTEGGFALAFAIAE